MREQLRDGTEIEIDEQDAYLLLQYRWGFHLQGKKPRCRHVSAMPKDPETGKGTTVLLSHLILNAEPHANVMHLNGDRKDFRRSNLKLVPHSDFLTRRTKSSKSRMTSRFKGVSFHAKSNQWIATISIGGRMKYLGIRRTQEEAARLYDHAARDAFGSNAALNFPEPGERSCLQPSPQFHSGTDGTG